MHLTPRKSPSAEESRSPQSDRHYGVSNDLPLSREGVHRHVEPNCGRGAARGRQRDVRQPDCENSSEHSRNLLPLGEGHRGGSPIVEELDSRVALRRHDQAKSLAASRIRQPKHRISATILAHKHARSTKACAASLKLGLKLRSLRSRRQTLESLVTCNHLRQRRIRPVPYRHARGTPCLGLVGDESQKGSASAPFGTVALRRASLRLIRERRLVRKERFELSRSCERQPLKL